MVKEKKKKKFFGLGCLIWAVVIFLFFMGLGFYLAEAYRSAEIKYTIEKKFEPNFNNIKKYNEFSNKEARELAVKTFLLDECEGGQKTIDKMWDYDRNILAASCTRILKLNLKKNEILSSSKTELENLKYLNTINFGYALDEYKSFINEP
tara:strand:+ start:254 stop:703 length:450 start_codon:yes stop_codon:yes gene_type:complete